MSGPGQAEAKVSLGADDAVRGDHAALVDEKSKVRCEDSTTPGVFETLMERCGSASPLFLETGSESGSPLLPSSASRGVQAVKRTASLKWAESSTPRRARYRQFSQTRGCYPRLPLQVVQLS